MWPWACLEISKFSDTAKLQNLANIQLKIRWLHKKPTERFNIQLRIEFLGSNSPTEKPLVVSKSNTNAAHRFQKRYCVWISHILDSHLISLGILKPLSYAEVLAIHHSLCPPATTTTIHRVYSSKTLTRTNRSDCHDKNLNLWFEYPSMPCS